MQKENEALVFSDGVCPRCGELCGNGGVGPLRCPCGWEGQMAETEDTSSGTPKSAIMQAYNAGANMAIYYTSKSFCVASADIRATDIPIREKAKLLAQRIQKEVTGEWND